MESVERALAIRRTTSLDQLDWDLAAEAIDNGLPADDERTDWFRREHLQGETFKALADTSDICREGLCQQLIEFKEEMQEELHPLRDLLAA